MAKKIAAKPKTPDIAPFIAAQIVPMDCGCDGCEALARLYGSDVELHLFYRRKLLTRGWAGSGRESEEKLFQRHHVSWAAERETGIGQVGKKPPAGDAQWSDDEESGMDAVEVPA